MIWLDLLFILRHCGRLRLLLSNLVILRNCSTIKKRVLDSGGLIAQ